MATPDAAAGGHIRWVDVAKGVCIVLVVMMHSTLGVEAAAGAQGWLHEAVAFATPFRIPAFFLVAGLFLARTIDRPWTDYLDRKVLHFAYFYVLWLTIQFAFKAPGMAAQDGPSGPLGEYLVSFVQPYGTLWFIYLLPVFFLATRLLRPLPPALVLAVGAALEIAHLQTGWVVADEFTARYVYFFAGYALAPHAFALARHASQQPLAALGLLAAWAVANGWLVASGLAEATGGSLVSGALGACAVVAFAGLVAPLALAAPLAVCGAHSLMIYLAFFLPMAATRIVLLRLGLVPDIGAVSALVTLAAVTSPLLLWWLVRGTRLDWLFVRPARARLAGRRSLAPAS